MPSRKLLPQALFLALATASASAQTHPAPPATALTQSPIPNAAAQIRARDMIRALFKNDYAKKSQADRRALAKLLLLQARETKDDSVARYVAFTESLDIAAAAGDATTAMAVIAELARTYAITPLDLQRQTLLRTHSATVTAEESEAVMHFAIEIAQQAAAIDAFDAVQQLADLAELAANKSRQVRIAASIQVPLANLRDLCAEFILVKRAFTNLDKNREDTEAHLTIGRFYALHKGQWSLGLPHLAQSSDDTLRELARQELSPPVTDEAQLALADRWWEFAEASSGVTRENASVHARQWYVAAQNHITGITLTRIQSRINNSLSTATAPGMAAAVASRAIDLSPLLDPAKDIAQGKWIRLPSGEIACESGAYSVIEIPYSIPDEYDLAITFTRTDGSGPIAVMLNDHGHAFDFALDMKGEARFERVDTRIAKDNPTTVPVAIGNNHRYILTIEIRRDRVRALLDGNLLTEYKTDGKDLSRYAPWKVLDTTLCAIGANNAGVLFHALQLTEVTGKGKPSRTK